MIQPLRWGAGIRAGAPSAVPQMAHRHYLRLVSERKAPRDPLAPARGILFGLLLASLIWLVAAAVYLAVR